MNNTTKNKIKACMVGGGIGSMIGVAHRHGLQANDDFELVGACFSQTLEKTITLAEELGIAKENCYADYKDMITKELAKPEGARVIVIATPDKEHYPQAKFALNSGMHVICEKPVTLELSESQELMKLSQDNKLLFGVTFTWNGANYIEDAKNIVSSGKIGSIRAVNVRYVFPFGFTLIEGDPTHPNHKVSWRFKNSYGKAGIISDVGSHAFQYTNYITGIIPQKIFAKLVPAVQGRESDDTNSLVLDYGNNVIGSMFITGAALSCTGRITLEIIGTKGSLLVDTNGKGENIVYIKNENLPLETRIHQPQPDTLPYFASLYEVYAKAIRNNTVTDYNSYISIKHGVETMKMIKASLSSNDTNTWSNV